MVSSLSCYIGYRDGKTEGYRFGSTWGEVSYRASYFGSLIKARRDPLKEGFTYRDPWQNIGYRNSASQLAACLDDEYTDEGTRARLERWLREFAVEAKKEQILTKSVFRANELKAVVKRYSSY